MKIHYAHPTYGVVCHTNRTRRTSRQERVTSVPVQVTCLRCRKAHSLDAAAQEVGK
jgi:hypothetical protein